MTAELWSYVTFGIVIVQLIAAIFALMQQDERIKDMDKRLKSTQLDIESLQRITRCIPPRARAHFFPEELATNRDAAVFANKVDLKLDQLADALGYYHKAEETTPSGWTKKVTK